jgi:predicted nucleotide-binding protein
MKTNYIDIFIKNKYDEIPTDYIEDINKLLPFYSDIPRDDLTYLFAYLHYKFNSLFEFMNDKMNGNNHYNAHESRELISTIDLKQKLDKALINSQYAFEIDNEYLNIINICNTFLEGSGGSTIPDNFNKIDIIEVQPIFNLISPSSKMDTEITTIKKEKNMIKIKNKVFIVHGHDNETKQEVARFIEKIGLETIILHEQANNGMTIIEKIEYYTNEANFAIILYTPCDKGRGTSETKVEARYRARQNVVFEHGYLMAKIGRKNVCALVKGEIETPSDISGVVYTPLDFSGGWKNKLLIELKSCGYEVNI